MAAKRSSRSGDEPPSPRPARSPADPDDAHANDPAATDGEFVAKWREICSRFQAVRIDCHKRGEMATERLFAGIEFVCRSRFFNWRFRQSDLTYFERSPADQLRELKKLLTELTSRRHIATDLFRGLLDVLGAYETATAGPDRDSDAWRRTETWPEDASSDRVTDENYPEMLEEYCARLEALAVLSHERGDDASTGLFDGLRRMLLDVNLPLDFDLWFRGARGESPSLKERYAFANGSFEGQLEGLTVLLSSLVHFAQEKSPRPLGGFLAGQREILAAHASAVSMPAGDPFQGVTFTASP